MKRLLTVVLLICTTCAGSAASGPGNTNDFGGKRVLIIGIDGLRSDMLQQQVTAGHVPNIAGLINNGTVTWSAYAGGTLGGVTQQPTISGPGWTSILTSSWMNRHNVNGNGTPAYNQPGVAGSYLADQAPHFAKRLKESTPTAYFSSVTSWSWIEDYLIAAPANQSHLDFHVKGTGSSYPLRDESVKNLTVSHLGSHNPDVLFLHFDQADGAGHGSGFTSAPYLTALTTIDGHIGSLMAAINARPQRASEKWMVILTTDHGGTSGGSHGGQSVEERRIPFIVSGDDVPHGVVSTASPGQAAVPATTLRYLGVSIPAAWNFAEDGFVTGTTMSGQRNLNDAVLTWSLPQNGIPGLTGLVLKRNGTTIATLATSATTHTDTPGVPGDVVYTLELTGTAEAPLIATVKFPNPNERIWDDANANNQWNIAGTNWMDGKSFANGNDVIFQGTAGEAVTVHAGGVSPATTSVTSGSYTFSGGSIGGTLAKSGNGSLTLSSANTFTATTVAAGPNDQLSGALVVGNANSLGSGAVTLTNTNSMTALFVPSGSMTLANNIALSSSSSPITTRLLTDEANVSVTLSGILSGGNANQQLLIDNDSGSNDQGKIRLTNASNSFTVSRVAVNRGGLVVTSDGALGNADNDLFLDVTSNLANSGLILEGTVSLNANRAITLGSQVVIDTQTTADSIAGPITYTGQLVKRGSAALTLGAAGSGAGGVSLLDGNLTLGNSAALGSGSLTVATGASAGFLTTTPLAGAVTVANNIALPSDTSATNRTILMKGGSTGNVLTLSGVISGGSSANTTLYLNTDTTGDNAATFALTGENTFVGKTQLNRGNLSINSNAALGAAGNVLIINANVGSKLGFTSPMTFTHATTLSTDTVFDLAANSVDITAALSGAGSLTKNGEGVLTLSASNPHTGSVSVTAGALKVNGSITASANAVNVSNGAVLSGIGTINRPVTVNGTLAPGDGLGSLNIPAAVTLAPGAAMAVQIGNWSTAQSDSVVANSIAITATPASKLTIHLDVAAMTNFTNVPKSFVIASTASGITGLATNNWAVAATGFSGTWSLQVSGNNLLLNYAPSGYDTWPALASLPPDKRGFSDDADGDGIANGLEYVLGLQPGSPSLAGQPTQQITSDSVVFTFRQVDEASSVNPTVEYSTTLTGTWTPAQDGVSGVVIASTPLDATSHTVTVTIPRSGRDKLFVRLRATRS